MHVRQLKYGRTKANGRDLERLEVTVDLYRDESAHEAFERAREFVLEKLHGTALTATIGEHLDASQRLNNQPHGG